MGLLKSIKSILGLSTRGGNPVYGPKERVYTAFELRYAYMAGVNTEDLGVRACNESFLEFKNLLDKRYTEGSQVILSIPKGGMTTELDSFRLNFSHISYTYSPFKSVKDQINSK